MNLKKRTIVGIIGLLMFSSSALYPLEKSYINTLKDFALSAALIYGTHIALCAAHEGGHILASKIALAAGAATSADENNSENMALIFQKNYLGVYGQYPEFENKKINALVAAAGPIAGILGAYVLLKLNGICTELTKKQSATQALYTGMKKSCINSEQSKVLGGVVFGHWAANLLTLAPYKIIAPYHGYQICEDLNFFEKK